jgi:hypothetical protein
MSEKESDMADVPELMSAPSLTDFFDQLNREADKKAFNNMAKPRCAELPSEKLPRS